MLGIISAMNVELESIKELMVDIKKKSISNISFYQGKINNKEVVIAVCGIGKVFAAICAQTMILNYKVDAILNVGVGGSLSKKLDVASVCISTSLVQHDMDTSPLGDPVGLISGINIVNIPADANIALNVKKILDKLNINNEMGVIASGDQFINDKQKKNYIKRTFNAIACEMEGAAIAQVCYVNKVPFCVIRAISDNADGNSHIDYPIFVKMAVKNTTRLIDEYTK